MSSRAEKNRQEIIKSKSPLARHSLNQNNTRDQRAGEIRLFGKDIDNAAGKERRNLQKRERAQALYDGINNIFQGQFSEEDILSVIVFAEEFERVDSEVPNAVTLDLSGLRPSNARFGEPSIFRKDEK